jgi:NDP-sugar pyrophosphorylase family protein|tara:strand:- start:2413 stop:3144 length:732 start_codon:yes stop_codon:yes gene_type:complete
MLTANDFFDLSEFEHASLFKMDSWVWQGLVSLESYLEELFASKSGEIHGQVAATASLLGEQISIGAGTVVEHGACIVAPAVIGANCEIRHGAYIRGQALLGDGCVVGHASEVKHAIMLNGAKAPHFAYVGDSILGNEVNLGAGTKLSNLAVHSEKSPATGRRPSIRISIEQQMVDTGLTKFGAVIGDDTQLGCNSVTNPGCLIGPRTLVYANASIAKGFIPGDSIVKLRQELLVTQRKQSGNP